MGNKASFTDLVDFGFGIQEGTMEVIKAVVKVHQYPPNKKTGVQGKPFPCVQITAAKCDENGGRMGGEDETFTHEFGVGSLDKFHPGVVDSATDEEAEDQGIVVNAEGNCVYVAEEGAKISKGSGWGEFTRSLKEKGFKPEVLNNGFMPDFSGLICHVHTETREKLPGSTAEKDPTVLVCDRILQYPYEKKGGKKKAAAPAPAAGKTPPAPKAAKPEETAAPSGDAATIAIAALTQVRADMAGQDEVERKKVQSAVQMWMMKQGKKVASELHKPAVDLVKDDNWLLEQAVEIGFVVDLQSDPNTCTFPEA